MAARATRNRSSGTFLRKAGGGRFGDGALGAFASSMGRGMLSGLGRGVGQAMAAAAVGGTASVIGGGKFANGAISAAVVNMFYDHMHAEADEHEHAEDPMTPFAKVTSAADSAVDCWINEDLPIVSPVMGTFAMSMTEEYAVQTTTTLGGGAIGGRLIAPIARAFGPAGHIFGDTAFGATRQGLLNQGYFRMGFSRHQGAQFRIGIGNWMRDIGRPFRPPQRPPNG